MGKYKSLLKNIGFLTLSNFGSKILVLFLIPLYTSILSTAQYGTFDLYSTTLSLLAPVLTLNIVHAVMRFSLDKKYDKLEVINIGIRKELIAQLVFIFIVLINYIFNFIPIFNEYPILLILLFFSQRFYTFFSQLSRGLDKIPVLAVGGVLNTILMLLLNILFLLAFKLELRGYFLANIASNVIPAIYMCLKLKVRSISLNASSKVVNREMVKYSKPMIFSTIGWWINNVSDRYIVTGICGIAENGIYSVAYKIPSMLNIVQNIFNQAWIISATKEYGERDSNFYINTYSAYNLIMILICSTLIIFNKVVAQILFNNEFYFAWKYAPFLMVSALFTGVMGYLEGIFVAAKNTKVIAWSTCVGATVNIVLNFAMVYLWGPIGAAISTMVSSILIWYIRIKKVKKVMNFEINIVRDIACYIIVIFQSFLFLANIDFILFYSIQFLCLVIIFILNISEVKKAWSFLKRIKSRKAI